MRSCKELQAWKFRRGDVDRGWYRGLEEGDWRDVLVPHDWSVEEPFSTEHSSGTGYVTGGIAWYRTHFSLDGATKRRVFLTFEGVYNHARVWINSNYLGNHPYGYTTFSYDITDFVEEGDNQISVRVAHVDEADSRWFTGSGITRRVFVTVTGAAAIEPCGVFVTTPQVSEKAATVSVKTQLCGETGDVRNTVMDAYGRNVLSAMGGELELSEPELWSPESPYLYTLKTEVLLSGEVSDCVETRFGVRTIRFDAETGFTCNGIPAKLRGVCVHHDAGCLGAAVPEKVWRTRLQSLKAAGCNAIRTSHNPPDVTLLDLCDEMGFFVMDEAFDEWEGPKNKWWQGHNVYPPKLYGYYEDFWEWGEKDVKSMVRRDRNHPCVILWSIGNEVDYPNDPYVHPKFESMTGNNDANKPEAERRYDVNRPNAARLATIAARLTAWIKEEDVTRPVTAALAFPELSNRTGYADCLDVVGYNYKEHLYEADCARFPGRVIYGSENGHHYNAWKAVRDNAAICGQFLWTGIDYMGEAHGWPVRCSPAGILDMAGFPKARYYQRQSWWTDAPMAYLATMPDLPPREDGRPHFVPPRRGWQYEEGAPVVVSCFTNCDRAELFLNDISLGVCEEEEKRWHCAFTPGTLRVCCTKDGVTVEDTLSTAHEAVQLAMTPDVRSIRADGKDVLMVTIELLDENGNLACNDQTVTVTVEGGALMGLENGNVRDTRCYAEPARDTFGGRLMAYVRTQQSGEILVTATAENLPAQNIRVRAV